MSAYTWFECIQCKELVPDTEGTLTTQKDEDKQLNRKVGKGYGQAILSEQLQTVNNNVKKC